MRDFDLKARMFKYPCSYLIDSAAFDALPPEMMVYVRDKLRRVLTVTAVEPATAAAKAETDRFKRLSADERRAIWEIVSETKPGFFE